MTLLLTGQDIEAKILPKNTKMLLKTSLDRSPSWIPLCSDIRVELDGILKIHRLSSYLKFDLIVTTTMVSHKTF